MAIIRLNESSVVTGSWLNPTAGTYTIGTAPTPTEGINNGDILVMSLRFWETYSSNSPTSLVSHSAPVGWSSQINWGNSGGAGSNNRGQTVWTRIADGTSNDTPTFTMTKTGTGNASAYYELTMFGLRGATLWSVGNTGTIKSTSGVSDAANVVVPTLAAGTEARIFSFGIGTTTPTINTANSFSSVYSRTAVVSCNSMAVAERVVSANGTYALPQWNVTNLYTTSGNTHGWFVVTETPIIDTAITFIPEQFPDPPIADSGTTVELIVKWTVSAVNVDRINFKMGIYLDPTSYDTGSTYAVSLGGGGYSGENALSAANSNAGTLNEYTYTPGGLPYEVKIRYRLIAGSEGSYDIGAGWAGYDAGPVFSETSYSDALLSFTVTAAPVTPTFADGFVTNASDPWSLSPSNLLNLPASSSVNVGDRWYFAERVQGGNTIITGATANLASLDAALGSVDQVWSNDGSGWVNAISALEGLGITFPITGPVAFPNVGFNPALDGIIVYSGIATAAASSAEFGFTYSWTDSPAGSYNGVRSILVVAPPPPPPPPTVGTVTIDRFEFVNGTAPYETAETQVLTGGRYYLRFDLTATGGDSNILLQMNIDPALLANPDSVYANVDSQWLDVTAYSATLGQFNQPPSAQVLPEGTLSVVVSGLALATVGTEAATITIIPEA